MSPNPIDRIWINPWKYYTVTADMDQPEIDAMMERVLYQARIGNEEELRKFDFVCLENPYLAWRRQRRAANQVHSRA
jgi:hypothetical protein